MSDDNSNLTKWQFPSTTIAANDYLIVWADKDVTDSGLHADFKLSSTWEAVFLSDSSGVLIDEILFGVQASGNTTYGRFPNGTGPWTYMNSSHNTENMFPVAVEQIQKPGENSFVVYPNPAKDVVNIRLDKTGEYNVVLRDINGRKLSSKNINATFNDYAIDINNYSSGLYFLTLTNSEYTITKKFIIK